MLHIGGGLERRNGKVLYWGFLALLLLAAWALTSCSNLWLPGNVGTGSTENATLAVSVPKAPTGVSASDGTYTDKVRITWTASSGATSYEVWRNTSSSTSSASKIGTPTSTSHDDTSATPGTTYYYWVKAKNSAGTSGFSASDTGWAIKVRFFSQRDPLWSGDPLGTCPGKTIGSHGCAVTCVAMVLANAGATVTPGLLNSWLRSNNGYLNQCDINWVQAASYDGPTGAKYVGRDDSWNNWTLLSKYLALGYLVVVKVDAKLATSAIDQHWVLVTAQIGNSVTDPSAYTINDPWDKTPVQRTLQKYYDPVYKNTFFAMRVYSCR